MRKKFILWSRLRCGLCELDDVMNNTIGAAVGYSIWKIANMAVGVLKSRRRGSGLT